MKFSEQNIILYALLTAVDSTVILFLYSEVTVVSRTYNRNYKSRPLIARSAIYVHRRSLLLVFSSSFSYGISEVMGLIIIGETVACTLRVIFSADFKVPKKPEKNALSPLLGSQATARLTPILGTLLDTFLRFFLKKVPSPYLHKTVHFCRIWSFW